MRNSSVLVGFGLFHQIDDSLNFRFSSRCCFLCGEQSTTQFTHFLAKRRARLSENQFSLDVKR